MAFFGELRGDVSPRIRLAKMKPEYNDGFNINISRIKPISKDVKESMLTYSERMQNISKTRKKLPEKCPLEVRAHKISKKYKFREILPDRKVLSLEQLVGKRKERKERPQSLDEVSSRKQSIREIHGISKTRTPRGVSVLPALPSNENPQKNLKVSFVNASDLYDFVDCSIRQSSFKTQPLGHIPRENDCPNVTSSATQSKSGHSGAMDTRLLPPITIYLKQRDETDHRVHDKTYPCDKIQFANIPEGETTTPLQKSQMEQLKIRPRRAKRMTLYKSGLDSIPETDRDLKREASLSNSFRWASSQQPLYLPRQNSPEEPLVAGSPRAERYMKSQRDIRVGMKVRPHSDPQTNVELSADYAEEFEDDHGFYEEDSFSSAGDDDSNHLTRYLQNRTSDHRDHSELT